MSTAKLPRLYSILLILCLVVFSSIVLSLPQSAGAQIGQCDELTPQGECTIFGTGNPPDPIEFNVSVSGYVPETAVQLQGYTAPGAFVIVTESDDYSGT